MKAVAVICEYNPFHNGHRFQLEQARALSGCDAVVCIMSGSLVQRGDVAVFDKWSRAKAALQGGADLVIELPAWFVLQSADMFAKGAVHILAKSHLAQALSFGSESADNDALLKTGHILAEESDDFKELMEKLMGDGAGYPAAIRACICKLYPELKKITENPNDMLGASYISATIKAGLSLSVVPVLRKSAYHDSDLTDGGFASSSAIRTIMKSGGDVSALTPFDTTLPGFDTKNIESFIMGFLRTCGPERIAAVPGAEDGIENRIISAAKKSSTIAELFEGATSKRYSLSRVRRTVFAAIAGLEKDMCCDYVRILGMTDTGAALLKSAKKVSELPFVTKTADFTPGERSVFKYDIAATDIAALSCNDAGHRKSGADFYNSPVKI